jgi:predicted nuclease with TOPRIM domain
MTEEMPDYKPETGTFGDYVPESNHPVLTKLKEELLEAQTKYADTYSRLTVVFEEKSKLNDKYRTHQYALEAKLKELLDDEEISIENAQAIADIFDYITLTKQVEISYTITANTTIEVPYGADPDEVADSTYVERIEFYTDFENAEILETDQEVEDWRVR